MVTVSCCQKLVVLCCIEDYIGQTTPVNSLLHWRLYWCTTPINSLLHWKLYRSYKACCIKITLVYKACCIEDYIGHTKPVILVYPTVGTGSFLDAWLMLIEKMVNPKTVLESSHQLPSKPTGAFLKPFHPIQYLIGAQKVNMHIPVLWLLWNSRKSS